MTKYLWLLFFLFSSTFTIASDFLPDSNYKLLVATNVCKNIARSIGSYKEVPAIKMISKTATFKVIARLKLSSRPTIYIDEDVYDLSVKLGSDSLNALSCILGHEMAHYYEDHSWLNSFADLLVTDSSILANQISLSKKIELEAKADYFGLFYGFLAGYETYKVFPKILTSIYEAYHLSDKLLGYPNKQSRIKIAQEKIDELSKLIHAFEVGRFLYLNQHFEEAFECYKFIIGKFPSKEIYNNLGVIRLNQISSLIGTDKMYFMYPFEFDGKARLLDIHGLSRGDHYDENKEIIKKHLEESKVYFQKAIALDPCYSTAYINLSCTYALLENYEMSIGIINELEKTLLRTGSKFPGNAHLVRGIAFFKNKQMKKAHQDFIDARKKDAYMVDYNYALFKKFNNSWIDFLSDWVRNWPRVESWIDSYLTIHGENTDKFFGLEKKIGQYTTAELKKLDLEKKIIINDSNLPLIIYSFENTDLHVYQIELNDKSFYTISTKRGFSGKSTAGLSVGSSTNFLIEKYGAPNKILTGSKNELYYFYKKSRIIFEVDEDAVISWTTYETDY
ncbi:hypothetical protein QQ008_08235 [Fulvivirgaceae bacterium BMA10]|uniref:Peptidase M48 domain-containing protein n=1 Tax=Splendidivirga corallicola TaxID=3051826 RepID=A0ABT8KKV8_9BACT|nr:hypothetical protein [Fulvivirgaceae bacterium BMA10]